MDSEKRRKWFSTQTSLKRSILRIPKLIIKHYEQAVIYYYKDIKHSLKYARYTRSMKSYCWKFSVYSFYRVDRRYPDPISHAYLHKSALKEDATKERIWSKLNLSKQLEENSLGIRIITINNTYNNSYIFG